MIVHYPLALNPAAIALDLWILARGDDLAARQPLPQIALVIYVMATRLALATVLPGGIALASVAGYAHMMLELIAAN